MKITLAVLLASLYGLSLRVMFDIFGPFMEVMSMSFLFLGPLIVGFLTIIFIPKQRQLTYGSAFFLPWLSCLVLLVLTIFLNLEGAICWIIIYPFFAIVAGLGGVIANKRRVARRQPTDDFDSINVSLLVMLPIPILLGLFEKDTLSSTTEYVISRQITIAAPAQKVWHNLANMNQINKQEHTATLTTAIGFPRHINTTLDTMAIGGHRTANFEKGLYFDETITRLIPNRLLALRIKTDPSKIPPTTMDEHILIGGKHIDVMDDIYTIERTGENSCKLQVSSRYKICSPFNWYAVLWTDLLLSDMLKSELNIIQQRSVLAQEP